MRIKAHFKVEFDFEDYLENDEAESLKRHDFGFKSYLMGYFQSDPEDMLRRAEKIQVQITLDGEQEIKKEVKLRLPL